MPTPERTALTTTTFYSTMHSLIPKAINFFTFRTAYQLQSTYLHNQNSLHNQAFIYCKGHKLLNLPHGMPTPERIPLTRTTPSTTKHSLIPKTINFSTFRTSCQIQSTQPSQSQHFLYTTKHPFIPKIIKFSTFSTAYQLRSVQPHNHNTLYIQVFACSEDHKFLDFPHGIPAPARTCSLSNYNNLYNQAFFFFPKTINFARPSAWHVDSRAHSPHNHNTLYNQAFTHSRDHELLDLPHGMPTPEHTAFTITTLSTTKHSLIPKTKNFSTFRTAYQL